MHRPVQSRHGAPETSALATVVASATVAILAGAPFVPARAAEPQVPPTADSTAAAAPSLDELLRIALRQSPVLHAREAERRAALERVPRAGALPDPELTWEFEGAPLEDPAPTSARENRFRLSQRLPFPGARSLSRAVAAADAEVAGASLDEARLSVVTSVRKSFYHLHHLYDSIVILEGSRAALRALADIAAQRYAVGRSSQQDALKAEVELAFEDARLAALRAEVPAVEARLNAILGREPGTPLGRPELPETLAEPAPAETLIARAFERSPVIRAAGATVAREKSGVGLARTEGRPELMLGAGYMVMKDEADAWMGMAGVTLPIWRGGKVGPARREAQASLAAAESEQERTRRDVAASVHEARAMVMAARARALAFADAAVPRAEQSFESARFAYENGRASFLDLLDAQRMLLSIRLEYADAFMDALAAEADLSAAIGDLPEVANE